ncbi:MAG: ABC transporter substrate-binding protein [Chloroflexota bacterium]
MKKLQILFGFLCLSFLLVACGGGAPAEPEAEAPEPTAETVEEEPTEAVVEEEPTEVMEEEMAEEEMEEEAASEEEEMDEMAESEEEMMVGTLADVAVEAGIFNTLVTAVTEAGLGDTFADASAGPFTVFAPTDDAFAALPEGTLEELLADPTGALNDILLYHVVDGSVDSATVVTLDSATTLNGQDVAIEVVDGGVVLNETVNVVTTDIEASNGIIHVIDAVLLPAAEVAAGDMEEMSCADGQRLFDNELLETDPVCIPENPERIVALAPAPFEVMIALGEQPPVGAIGYLESIYQRNFPYTNDMAAEVTFVGFPANLEEVVELEPDLIIQSPFGQEEIELVQEIAPTVILPTLPNVRWEENMLFTAELLNRTAEVEELLAQYDERVATLQELVGDPSEIEISVVRYYNDSGASGLQMQLANAFSTDMLADIGFARPESQAYTAEEATEIYGGAVAATLSLEELPLIDGEYLFAWSQAPDAEGDAANEEAWALLSEDPLWSTLEAVDNGQNFQVGGHWVGWGFHAAHEVLDDLFVHVAGVDPAEVSPNPFTSDDITSSDSMMASGEVTPLPRSVVDYEGNEVVIEDDSVVIPVDGPLTEIVYALGMGDKVVATDTSSTYPSDIEALPKVGYVRQLSAEPILALAPTLILTTDAANPPEAIAQLRESGVTVAQFKAPETIAESIQLVRDVAASLGVEDRGEALVAKMEADLAEAAELLDQVESTPRVMMIYARGVDVVSAAGSGTSVDVMFELAGVENAVTEWEGYQPLTAEGAVTISPDALLLFDSGLQSVGGPEGLLGVPGIAETPAGIDERIHSMDGLLLTGLGPRVGEAVIDLILMLHPELQ